jgi:hypothetical protein
VHRTAAGTVLALACALAFAAGASGRDLFILQAGGVSDSGHDLGNLVDDFLTQQGAFGGLALQPAYAATLDYLGIPNAMQLQATAFGTQVVLSIPSTGFSKTFTGATPDAVENQVEDFFKNDGAKELAKFYEKTNARTPLALIDGNPRSTTALFARSAFDRFGLGALRTRSGYSGGEMGEWGHFDLGIEAGGGAIDAGPFDSLYVADGALTLGGDFGRLGVYLSALGQYRSYDGAQIYDAGLELGLPIAVLGPGEGHWIRWVLTPVVQSGGGASRDLLAGGFMVGGGAVSSLGLNFGPLELTIADELFYYGGIPLGKIDGIRIETELDQWITRNGAKLALYPLGLERLSLEVGASLTNFLATNAAVDWYVSPFAGVGVKLLDTLRLRVGWEADLAEHGYAAQTGRVDLGLEF